LNGDHFAASTSLIKRYWPIVLILIMVVIVTLAIIYTKVYSSPLLVYYFEETKTLGTVFNYSASPQIASAGKDTYIVNIEKSGGKGNISIEKINYNTTASSIIIGNASANSTNAEVAASGDNVYAVWSDTNSTKGGNGDIFLSSSRDKAASFGEPINLSNNEGNSTNPEVTASGDHVYVVWSDTNDAKGGVGDIFFSASRDNAVSFGEPINLSDNERNSTNPEVAASGKNVYVVWADSRDETETPNNVNLNLKTSSDNGMHFGERKIVKRDVDKEKHLPRITASDGNVYITLADKDAKEGNPDNFQVILRTSTDNGTEFSNKKSLKKDIDSKTHLPHLSAFGSNVYVVWSDTNEAIGGSEDIFFSSSHDNARSFDEPINISNNVANSTNPEISAVENSVNIFWVDHSSGKDEIKYKQIRLAAMR
jgi:pterin-4a-carbinolamine dehydratase